MGVCVYVWLVGGLSSLTGPKSHRSGLWHGWLAADRNVTRLKPYRGEKSSNTQITAVIGRQTGGGGMVIGVSLSAESQRNNLLVYYAVTEPQGSAQSS